MLFPPNMGFAVRLLDRIGWLDEHPSLATAGEDNEWAHRALRAGVRIVYDPTVVVGHLARHRPADLPALYRRYARGQGAFYGTWLRRGDRFIARRAARDLVRAPWLLVRGLVTRNSELISMGRGEVTGLLPGILAGLRNPGVPTGSHRRSAGSWSLNIPQPMTAPAGAHTVLAVSTLLAVSAPLGLIATPQA